MAEGIVTITGPDLDLRTRDGVGAATSRALTAAQRHVRSEGERPVSFYVRGENGDAHARVDVEADGTTSVWRIDRGAGDARRRAEPRPASASPTRRPDPPAANEEEEVSSTPKTRSSSRSSHSAGKRSSARKTTTAAAKKTTTARRSGEVAAAAMNRVSAKDATTAILKAAEGPLSVAEIAEKVLATDGVKLEGKTPAATIAAILSVENKKTGGLFVRVEKGKYALRETAPTA